jgi:aminomethyltransferase
MPVQYTSILDEHRVTRSAAGLFDVSHMGEFEVEGAGALAALQWLATNDVAALVPGQVQYTALCLPGGGIVDDATIYRLGPQRFMITVNASNIPKDWAWVTGQTAGRPGVAWRDISAETGLIAVQGPRAEALVAALADRPVDAIGYYRFSPGTIAGVPATISRTGYTGEDGFELYLPAERTAAVWDALLKAGRPAGARPVGLGARDTLRLEMRYALYGNDIDETTNPIEAGLGWVVKPAKGDFLGRAEIDKVRAAGPRRRLVGIAMDDRSIARHGYRVLHAGREVGVVTSGSYGPSVDRSIAMAYVEAALAPVGTELHVDIRGQGRPARVVKTPFHPSRVKKAG